MIEFAGTARVRVTFAAVHLVGIFGRQTIVQHAHNIIALRSLGVIIEYVFWHYSCYGDVDG